MWHRGKLCGLVLAIMGLLVILFMILPTAFWWFVLGAAMIAVGLLIMKR